MYTKQNKAGYDLSAIHWLVLMILLLLQDTLKKQMSPVSPQENTSILLFFLLHLSQLSSLRGSPFLLQQNFLLFELKHSNFASSMKKMFSKNSIGFCKYSWQKASLLTLLTSLNNGFLEKSRHDNHCLLEFGGQINQRI